MLQNSRLFMHEIEESPCKYNGSGLGLWWLKPLSTIFHAVISWWSVLLVEETGGPGENHRPLASH